jgi:peptide/nickel transport system substrate-binding protein
VRGVRRWRWLAALAAVALAVAGVAVLRTDDTPEAPSLQRVRIRDGGRVQTTAIQEPSGFNPHTSKDGGGVALQAVDATMYPSVFRIHPDFSFQLDQTFMASAKLTSRDPQTITYQIRPEASWSDGTSITADDFHYLWQHSNGTNRKTDTITTVGYDRIKQVTGSADGKTVTVVFDENFAEWPSLFTNLLPAHYVQQQPGGWNRGLDKHPEDIPSGGPFKIAGFRRGETLTLQRNDRYWGPRAHLDQILIRLVPDSDAELAALRNHEADLINPEPTPDMVNTVRRLPRVRSQASPSLGFEHLTFNLKHPILAELPVRQAIATAIDTQQLVDRMARPVNPDAQVLGNRIWLTGQQPYQDHSGGYGNGDTRAARQLLEQADWTLDADGVYAKKGKRLELRSSTFAEDPRRKLQGELLQDQLDKAGIHLDLANTRSDILFGEWIPKGNFDITNFYWLGNSFAISASQDIYRTGGGGNFGKFTDPTIDALYQQAIGELDPTRAADIGNQIDQQLWTQLPTIPLYQVPSFLAWRQDLLNVVSNPTTESVFWNAGSWGYAKP